MTEPGAEALRALGNVAAAIDVVRRCYGVSTGCVYCGAPYDTADHVHPRKHGGLSLIGNLVPACLRCNQKKGALLPADFFGRHPHRAREFLKRATYADQIHQAVAMTAVQRHMKG